MGRSSGCLVIGVILSWMVVGSSAFNVTLMLNAHPKYSLFNQLLSSSGVAGEVNSRSSLTVLAIENSLVSAFTAANPNVDAGELADLLRYHVLLQYLDFPELRAITNGNPITVTTLLQTTGRTTGNDGNVNIYHDSPSIQIGLPDPSSPPNATIVMNVTQTPYNISILQVDQVLIPPGWGTPAADGANITAILESSLQYNTLISLLQSTGADAELAAKQTGTGITFFAPNDAAFGALPAGALAKLTPEQAKSVLLYHTLTAYYPLGTLSTLDSPAAPTLASTAGGKGSYTLSITAVGGKVTLGTGVNTGNVSSTLFDTNPTAVFEVSSVLLPPEIFAAAPALAPSPASPASAPAPLTPSPAVAPSPLTPAPAPTTPAPSPAPVPSPVAVPAPAPSPRSPHHSPVPSPAIAPGPPAPPTSPEVTSPSGSPASAPSPSAASKSQMSKMAVSALVAASGILLLL